MGKLMTQGHDRLAAVENLGHAIGNCHRKDACKLMEPALECLRAGAPVPYFDYIQIEADSWAALATPFELRAYAWAIWKYMPNRLRAKFRAFVRGAE